MLNFGHTAGPCARGGHQVSAVPAWRGGRLRHAGGRGDWPPRAVFSPRPIGDALAAQILQMGPLPPVSDLSAADIVEATKRDKKVIAGRLHFVLPTSIGTVTTVSDVTPEELTEALLATGLKRDGTGYSIACSFSLASRFL